MPVTYWVRDVGVAALNKTTGELIRHLTLNPDTGYQPRFKT